MDAAVAFRKRRSAAPGDFAPGSIEQRNHLSREARAFLLQALLRDSLSGRAYVRVIGLARTIADLDNVLPVGVRACCRSSGPPARLSAITVRVMGHAPSRLGRLEKRLSVCLGSVPAGRTPCFGCFQDGDRKPFGTLRTGVFWTGGCLHRSYVDSRPSGGVSPSMRPRLFCQGATCSSYPMTHRTILSS